MAVQQYCLRWNNHQPNFISVFSSLLSSQSLVDVTLAAEGKHLQAHKVVLSACSSYFQSLFATNPCKHPIVILKDVKFGDLRVMVDFMYHGEVSVSQEQLPYILKTAEMLKIKGLTEIPVDNSAKKCYLSEKSDISPQPEENWSLEETSRATSPSSPSCKRRRLKKNVICNTATITEPTTHTEHPPSEILVNTVGNVFETVLKSEPDIQATDNSGQKYNGSPIPSIHPGPSSQRDPEPTHHILTQLTPPEVNTTQSIDCSHVEIPRTCTSQSTSNVTHSPPTPSQSPTLEIHHMGPKRGRFLMRQSRIKKETEQGQESDIDMGLTQYLTIPPVRIERQCSEPIRTASPSPDNLLHVPDHVLVKQHSHPILPTKVQRKLQDLVTVL
ncbi:hypothetical protein JTB14_029403 [Gonioctena quinquepunctata]|nr:hypothetical protein JTB14_029403 [Gonioctena quinquepunctata]